jgi:superkiller protein 3
LKAQGNLTPAQAAWERGVALLEAQLPEPGQVRVEDLIRLGDAYLQAGRADQARQTYLQAQAMDSGNPDVQRGLGNAAINLGDLAGAEQAYSAWVAAAPDDPTALNALGVVQVKQNRAVEGRETLRKAMDASPCSSATSLLDGGQYILEGKYPEAEAAFTRAAEIEPDNPSTLYLLGVSQYLQEKLEPAAATLERALQIDPELVQVKRALATALGELNRYEEALPLWLEVVQKLPDDPSGWMSLGTAHEKLGSYDQAIDAYTQALKLGDDANIHSYIGLVFLEKGQPDKAAQEFDLALKLNPQSSLAYGGKGDAYLQMGEVASAIAAYRKSLTLQENVPLRAQLGALLLQTGDLEGAARELGAAVQADPVNAPYREQLGKVLYRLGHLDESMQQYQSILDVDANNSSAWLGLGQIAYKRCDLEGMAQAFEHAAGLQRGNAYYQALPGAAYAAKGAVEQQAQVYFNLGQDFPDDPVALLIGGEYAWQQGDLPAAVEKLEQAAQTGEAMPEIKSLIYYHLGAMSLIQNELVDAEEQFRSSLEASPANAASQTALGDIFLLRGDAVQALEAYTLALELLPGYAAQFSGDAADLLGPELHARRALALERLGEDTEAEQAWEQAVTLARRLIDQTPDWPQAHHSLGSILYMSGDDAQAEDEFTQMAECDAWLGKVNPQALTYLDRLR